MKLDEGYYRDAYHYKHSDVLKGALAGFDFAVAKASR